MPYRIAGPRKPAAAPRPPRAVRQKAEIPPWQVAPDWWPRAGASLAEWAIWWALERLGIFAATRLSPAQPMRLGSEEFDYRYDIGLSQESGNKLTLGGAEADFYVPSRRLAIRIQGLYFHYGLGADKIAFDELMRIFLEQQGVTVVDIDEDHALANPLYYAREALDGRDHSRSKIK